MLYHVNIIFEHGTDKSVPKAAAVHEYALAALVGEGVTLVAAALHPAHPKRGCDCDILKAPLSLVVESPAYHFNTVVESEDAAGAEKNYRAMLGRLLESGCMAHGAFHAIDRDGCSCNVLDPMTVLPASIKGRKLLGQEEE